MAELDSINKSGELTEIKIAGTDEEKVVLTKEQIDALFGDFTFVANVLKVLGYTAITVLKDSVVIEAGRDVDHSQITLADNVVFNPKDTSNSPVQGMVYFDKAEGILKCWDGHKWNNLYNL